MTTLAHPPRYPEHTEVLNNFLLVYATHNHPMEATVTLPAPPPFPQPYLSLETHLLSLSANLVPSSLWFALSVLPGQASQSTGESVTHSRTSLGGFHSSLLSAA